MVRPDGPPGGPADGPPGGPVSTRPNGPWSARWNGWRLPHPTPPCLQPVKDLWAELSQVEVVDRSLALGAQALLALIPLLMVLGVASRHVGAEGLHQVREIMGVPEGELQQLAVAASRAAPPDTSTW